MTPDDSLMNHPYVRTKAAALAELAASNEHEGCTLLRAAALLLATMSNCSDAPEDDLSVVLDEFGQDARMLLEAFQTLDESPQSGGVVQ